jgi:hypothetical protein
MITINIFGSAASVDASAVPEDVWHRMEAVERRWRPRANGGEWRDHHIGLYRSNSNGEVVFPSGLIQRFVRELDRHNLKTRLRANDLPEHLELDHAFSNRLNATDQRLVSALRRHRNGLITCANDRSRIRTIGTICGAYPRARIFIAVATVEQQHEMFRRLDKELAEPVCSVRGGSWETSRRITVGTYRSLETISDHRDWQFVLFPSAETAISRRPIAARLRLLTPRVVGLVDAQAQFSESERLRLDALAGPVIATTAGVSVPTRVEVRFVDVPGHLQMQVRNPLTLKRRLYWQNDARNRCLSEIAKGIWEDVSFPHGRRQGLLRDFLPVTVLTEAAEHANQLRRFLPGWNLLTAEPHRRTKLDRVVSAGSLPARSIMTMSVAERLMHFDAGQIIVASGAEWLTNSGIFLSSNDIRSISITDFEDFFHPVAEEASRERHECYRRAGFQIESIDEVPTD